MNTLELLWALDDMNLDAYQRSVAMHILRRGFCWEKSRALGDACGMSHVKAGNVLDELCELGVIVPDTQNGRFGWRINTDICKPDLQAQQNNDVNHVNNVNGVNANVNHVNKSVNHVYIEEEKEDKQIKNKNTPLPPNGGTKPEPKENQKVLAVLECYGETVEGKQVPRYTKSREKVILTLLKDKVFSEKYPEIFRRVNQSDFLMGRGVGSWGNVDFDWIFKKRKGEVNPNWQIILDGRYDNKPQHSKQPANRKSAPRPATNPQYKRPVGAHT